MPAPQRIELLSARTAEPRRVRMRLGTRVVEGIGPDGDAALEAVGAAALHALSQLVPHAVTFQLERLHLIDDDRPVAVVVVTLSLGGVRNRHAGAALVDGGDQGLAVAKAVLAALNRRLEVLGL